MVPLYVKYQKSQPLAPCSLWPEKLKVNLGLKGFSGEIKEVLFILA